MAPMPTDAAFLAQTRLFARLDDDERAVLASQVTHRTAKPGEVLFNAEDPGDTMFIVHSGQVELFIHDNTGQKIVLGISEMFGTFGEVSLLDGGPRTASAVALEETDLGMIDREDLLTLFKKRPEAALDMLAAVGDMTRRANQLLRSRVSKNVNEEIVVHDRGSMMLRAADWVANFSGSLTFLVLHIVVFALWLTLNIALPQPFDAYPFGLLTMWVSLEAIILSTLLLFSGNRSAARDRIRSDVEYEVNLKAELEIAHLHQKSDKLREDVLERLARIERQLAHKSPSAAAS
jgi:CRP/FNR family cyclic AMP-dependent transcriptional regulator